MNFIFSIWFLLFFAFFSPLHAQTPSPFAAVFVDDATEKEFGPFPYDRSRYVQAMKILRQAGAKAVVIKFFMDQDKPGPGDDQLAAEMKLIPALLQARLDPKEPKSNPLPTRFDRSTQVTGDTNLLLTGESGWIPLGKFSQNCAGIGFVDIASANRITEIPMVIRYKKSLLPSLELAAVEMALGQFSKIEIGKNLTLAGHQLALNPTGTITVQLPAKDKMHYLSFGNVLRGKFDRKLIDGKIVVLGFDAKGTPTLPTSLGPLKIHRLFFYSLESLYQQLMAH